jgi:hypothetical protein
MIGGYSKAARVAPAFAYHTDRIDREHQFRKGNHYVGTLFVCAARSANRREGDFRWRASKGPKSDPTTIFYGG